MSRRHAHRHMTVSCPNCGQQLSGCVGEEGEKDPPKSGDYTICVYCRGIGKFLVTPFGVSIRSATEKEVAEFHKDFPDLL